jgi:hypothetical protein
MKKSVFLASMLAISVHGSSAFASGDMEPEYCSFWSVGGCQLSAYPFIAPENDTRSNLLLMINSRLHLGNNFPDAPTDASNSLLQPFNMARQEEKLLPEGIQETLAQQATQLTVTLPQGDANDPVWQLYKQFFQALLADNSLTPEQRHILALLRLQTGKLPAAVNSANNNTSTPATTSTPGATANNLDPEAQAKLFPGGSHAAEFRDYLQAAQQFSSSMESSEQWKKLAQSAQPWVAETATYMLFRVKLLAASTSGTDDSGFIDHNKLDKGLLTDALALADSYQKKYPQGLYSASVEGLYRRIYWFAGDTAKQSISAEQSLYKAKNLPQLQSLVNEFDLKLISENSFNIDQKNPQTLATSPATPALTATQLLLSLRSTALANTGNKPPSDNKAAEQSNNADAQQLSENVLNSLRPAYDTQDWGALWQYLHLSYLFYQQKNYAAVVEQIAETKENDISNSLTFSTQILRGLALQQQQNWPQAEALWRHLLTLKSDYSQQQFLQLMLANNLVYQKQSSKVFVADSPITNLRFRSLVLKVNADAPLLRQQTKQGVNNRQRVIALHTLLVKDLSVADYASYQQDIQLVSQITPLPSNDKDDNSDIDLSFFNWDGNNSEPGYACASLNNTVQALIKNGKDGHALNCMGEFLRLKPVVVSHDREDNHSWGINKAPQTFAGTPVSRLVNYQNVIANPKSEPEDRSYALYRAVMCYAPSGNNSCDAQDIDKKTRKHWFDTLRADYPGSLWAKKLRYYW